MKILSLGAGVQSTALLLMALHGEFPTKPDCAIFADTGWEPEGVYEHLTRLEKLCDERWRFPIHRVSAGDIKADTIDNIDGEKDRFASMPFHVRSRIPVYGYPEGSPTPAKLAALYEQLWQFESGEDAYFDLSEQIADLEIQVELTGSIDGQGGMLRRQCTKAYKIVPVQQEIRRILLAAGLPKQAELWMGISFDEWRRMKESRVQWLTHVYPLVDRRLTRWYCEEWLEAHGYTVPPKSACIGCPYHSNAVWREMKINDPTSFREAVAFDAAIRTLPRVDGEVFLHSSLKPLDQVDFRNAEDHGQTTFGTGFDQECEGMCGV